MTAATPALARCTPLVALDEAGLGARMLATLPTHEFRSEQLLRQWAADAAEFGRELARRVHPCDLDGLVSGLGLRVLHATGGRTTTRLTLAEYVSRPPAIRIFDDGVATADQLVDELGWRAWFPAGSIEQAAICHEAVHRILHRENAAELKRRLNHVLIRVGPFAWRAHVLGADEIVAHSFGRAVLRLPKSPLLISAALAEATCIDAETPSPHGKED